MGIGGTPCLEFMLSFEVGDLNSCSVMAPDLPDELRESFFPVCIFDSGCRPSSLELVQESDPGLNNVGGGEM